MSFADAIRAFVDRWRTVPVQDWYSVTFDDRVVTLDVRPPGRRPWQQQISWDSIVRICFKPEFPESDGIYLFTSARPESYAIPADANGGKQLWLEILRRDLFDHALATKAAVSQGGMYCWPEAEQP